jgi:predicted LPLAT superfamily acyltransferase
MKDATPTMQKETVPTSTHWAQLNELSFVAGMRFLFFVFRIFGHWPFRVCLYPVLFWYVVMCAAPRQASQNYLQRIKKYVPVRSHFFGVFQHFSAFAESILEKMMLWGGLYPTEQVHYFGQQHFHDSVANQRGALLICSHMGNLELCRVLSRQFPTLKMTVLVHTKHAQAFNRMMGKLDPRSQLDLLQVTEISPNTAMLLAQRIEQGGLVVIAGDRVPVGNSANSLRANFLGEPANFPIGPYVLASILRCPAFMLFSLKVKGQAQIHFELLSQSIRLPRKNRALGAQEYLNMYIARLEHYCQLAPLQWFNFFDFWQKPIVDTTDENN